MPWVSEEPMTTGQLKCLIASTKEAYLCYLDRADNCETPAVLDTSIPDITDVIHEYCDLFEDPCRLPPQREKDHSIHLEPGAKPISVRPYRYPQF